MIETKEKQYLMRSYGRLPISFERGSGVWLWDSENNRYLDALCGIAVTGIGHSNPDVNNAIINQIKNLSHVSNLYRIGKQEQLAEKLCRISNMQNVFFCNSGSEANEAAIKLMRLFGQQKGIKEPQILVMEKAWHGRSLATLTATGSVLAQKGFGPLLPGFCRVAFNDIDSVKDILDHNQDLVGVLVEPIQGEAGIQIPDKKYLIELRAICDDREILLGLDEVQSGMGRTGKWFAHQHHDITPDVMTLAKGLGNGFPIGACLATGLAADLFQPGSHGSTFGGNPVGCAAAAAVISFIEKENLLTRAGILGEKIIKSLTERLVGNPSVNQIRGSGLMIAVELKTKCSDLPRKALGEGILINVTGENTIRLLPPLILSNEEAEQIVAKVVSLIENHDNN